MSVSGHIAGLHAHVAMVVGLGVEDVPSGIVHDSHQGIVSRGLEFVTERCRLRPAVEQLAGNDVALAARGSTWIGQNRRGPRLEVASGGLVNLGAADEHFASRQDDQAAAVAVQSGTEVSSIELVK